MKTTKVLGIIAAATILAACCSGSGKAGAQTATAQELPSVKGQAELLFADFEAVQPDGKTVKFSDYVGRGKYILVDFFASWCGPCMMEIPYLKAAYEKYHGDNFDIVGVAISDAPENTARAVEANQIPWNIIYNAQKTPAQLYEFNSIPQIFLFGPDGRLLKREGLRGDDMDGALAEFLK